MSFGMKPDAIQKALATVGGVPGRMDEVTNLE
jgi:UDP-N-acetylmuramyl tripeptide synthase